MPTTWNNLLAQKRVQPHTTSRQELDGLRAVIERDLRDATLPQLSDDRRFAKARVFCGSVVDHGVIVHPRHNWFVSAAHTDHDVERVLEATWEGFQAVRRQYGAS